MPNALAESILDMIQERLNKARQRRDADNINAALSRERVKDIEAILEDIEKKVATPDEPDSEATYQNYASKRRAVAIRLWSVIPADGGAISEGEKERGAGQCLMTRSYWWTFRASGIRFGTCRRPSPIQITPPSAR